MIATGSYRARASNMQMIKSPDHGTPGVSVTVRLEEGPNKGANIEWIGWLTDKTVQRTADSLALMGYDGSDPDTVSRQEFIAVIEHEEYVKANGGQAKRARVAWINDPSGGGRLEPMTSGEAADAKSRLKAALAAAKAKSAKPAVAEDEPKF